MNIQKFTIKNIDEFIIWRNDMRINCYVLTKVEFPIKYPCVIVTCDGEDSGIWTDYGIVYLGDFNI
jgi:hypothetical protein